MLYVTYTAFVFIAPPPFKTILFHFFHPLFLFFTLCVCVCCVYSQNKQMLFAHYECKWQIAQPFSKDEWRWIDSAIPWLPALTRYTIVFASFEPYDLFIYLFCRRRISLSIMLAAVSIIFSAFHLLISLFFCVSGCRMTLFYAVWYPNENCTHLNDA